VRRHAPHIQSIRDLAYFIGCSASADKSPAIGDALKLKRGSSLCDAPSIRALVVLYDDEPLSCRTLSNLGRRLRARQVTSPAAVWNGREII
jgi:hypothetical protein